MIEESAYLERRVLTAHIAGELYQIPITRIDGNQTTLAEFQGSVLLIVNVASACGLTCQYAGLESL